MYACDLDLGCCSQIVVVIKAAANPSLSKVLERISNVLERMSSWVYAKCYVMTA